MSRWKDHSCRITRHKAFHLQAIDRAEINALRVGTPAYKKDEPPPVWKKNGKAMAVMVWCCQLCNCCWLSSIRRYPEQLARDRRRKHDRAVITPSSSTPTDGGSNHL